MTEQQIIESLATKVMGWTKHEVELDMTDGSKQRFFDSWRLKGTEVAVHWNPLQNIADAWMLIEKLRQRYFCEVAMTETDDGYWHWMARYIEVLESPYRVKTYKAVEKEAPMAISMAAYKLVA